MTTLAIISLVSLAGWLILMVANYRSYQVPHAKTLRQLAIWVLAFAGVAVIFKSLGLG